jgi:membrane protease YdiL (CAAX protease family)
VDTAWLQGGAVLLVCLGTAVGGLVFSWLRLRSGSLLAPVLLHLATNSLGSLTAAAASRLG